MIEDQLMTNFTSELLVVLVIYKMKITESPTYQSLTTALGQSKESILLFVYDNSPEAQEIEIDKCWIIHYLHDPSNPGVSKAYNEGFRIAKELNKKWLLLVDQDTIFPMKAFESYLKCISEFRLDVVVPILKDEVGIISPFKFYFGGGSRLKNIRGFEMLKLADHFFVNSGILISILAFERAGKYDENLPLDFSDIAFVQRLKMTADYFTVSDSICHHELSSLRNCSVMERLNRFTIYLQASRYFRRHYTSLAWIQIRGFFQAMKLSFRYMNFRFLLLYFK
jgi:GT2 family glycosyltransferase